MTDGPSRQQRAFGDREAPLTLGTVRGVRGWTIASRGPMRAGPTVINTITLPAAGAPSELRLLGMAQSEWKPGANVAQCTTLYEVHRVGNEWKVRQRSDDHQLVDLNCTCGFYAYWTLDRCETTVLTPVIGIIEGWGRTVIGTKGFRCENARILALAPGWVGLPSMNLSVLHEIADWYGVPLYPDGRAMIHEFPTRSPDGLEPREVS